MSRYGLTPRARADLEEIWDYTAGRWGAEQAETYIRAIQSAIERIARDPARGRSCDEIRRGYFKYPSGSHVLFYRIATGGIQIVRILHQRMDFERHVPDA